jgi:hypothetical protein
MEKNDLMNDFEKAAAEFVKIEELLTSKPLSDYINNKVQEKSLFRNVCEVDFNPTLNEEGQAVYDIEGDEPVVWTMPSLGYVVSDHFDPWSITKKATLPIFSISAAKDWAYKHMKDRREDVIMQAGNSIAKALSDYEEEAGWKCVSSCTTTTFSGMGMYTPRPANIYQMSAGDPSSGYFSKELVNRLIVGSQRCGKTIKEIWVSPEDMADIREWSDTDVDPITRYSIFMAAGMSAIWGINLRVVESLGIRGKYNINGHTSQYGPLKCDEWGRYNDYGIVHPNVMDENGHLVIAGETQVYAFSDKISSVFKMPIPEPYKARWDYALIRRQRSGFYGWTYMGIGLLEPNHIFMGVIDRYSP